MKRILPYITFFILISAQTAGQTSKISYELFDNWMIGGSGGMSYLAMEMKKDLPQATMDMNSLPDLTYSFHLTKRINKKYDVGVEHRKSYFNGYKNYSSNVVWLMHSNRFNSDIVDFHPNPIYYKTYISMWALDAKLNFPNFYSVEKSEMNANLYLRASSGISYIGVELGFRTWMIMQVQTFGIHCTKRGKVLIKGWTPIGLTPSVSGSFTKLRTGGQCSPRYRCYWSVAITSTESITIF
jgi:hypothetical protein